MARNFNGTSDFINCGTGSNLNITTSFSVAGWGTVGPARGDGQPQFMCAKDSSGQRNFAFGIDNSPQVIRLECNGTIIAKGNTTLTAGTLHHLAATVSISGGVATPKVYLDGVDNTNALATTVPGGSTAAFTIGERIFSAFEGQWSGLIADVAIWNTALLASDVANLAAGYRPIDVNSANLQGWWPLGTGGVEPDTSGNGNSGTLTGTTITASPDQLNRGARKFSGSPDLIQATQLSLLTPLTMAAWVRHDGGSELNPIVVYNGVNNSSNGYGIFVSCPAILGAGNTNWAVFFAGASAIDSLVTLTTGVWYHLAFTHVSTPSTVLYTNGVKGTVDTSINPSTALSFLKIGDGASSDNGLHGTIADVAIWNAGLLPSEIAALAAGIRPGNIQPASLQAWWPLDSYKATETDASGGGNTGTVTGTVPAIGPPIVWRISG